MTRRIFGTEKRLIINDDDSCVCYCGKHFDSFRDLEQIYDDCGIYAGRCCSYECAEKNLGINLHYTRRDAAECGENLDSDY